MAACAAEQGLITKPRKRVVGNVLAFFTKLSVPAAKLDLEAMPDRVKRDLGFLDGRDPRYEDDRLR
jgi:hypothetical protein